MAQSVTLPVKGLYVDPNPLTQGGRGALCRADNIIFDRPGSAQSRPSFAREAEEISDFRPRSMYRWADGVIASVYDGSTWDAVYDYGDTLTGDVEPPDNGLTPMVFMEARKSLYLTTMPGVRKLVSGTFATEEPGSWVIPWFLFGFALPGGQLGDGVTNYRAAYRYVCVSKDVQGYTRRSAPSPRLDYAQDGTPAVGYGLSGRFYLHEGVKAGDQIELYRTKIVSPETVTPSEEYYLADIFDISAADIANGYTELFQDNVLDEQLGAALYTNPSVGGIESANEVPPKAKALAWFENCAWYGNTSHRQRLSNEFINSPTTAEIATQTMSCNLVLGDFTITTVDTSAADLRVGMAVCSFTGPGSVGDGYWGEGNAYFDPDTLITGISEAAGTYYITLDKAAKFTGARDCSFVDVVTITHDGVVTNFYWMSTPLPALTAPGFNLRTFGDDTPATPEARAPGARNSFAYVLNAYMWANQADFRIKATFFAGGYGSGGSTSGTQDGRFYLESLDMGATAFTLTSNRTDFFKNLLSIGQNSDPTEKPHRVYYSKPDEPEAVPIINFLDIGSEAHAIQALIAAGQTLYVFKTDGVYKVTGSAPSSWRVDLISANHRLLYGGACCAVNGSAVGWTDQGVVAFTDSEVTNLSQGKIDTLLRQHIPFLDDMDNGQWYKRNAWMAYWPTKDYILVGYVPGEYISESDPPNGPTSCVYAFHVGSGEWSKWDCGIWAAVYIPNIGQMEVAWENSEYLDFRISAETSGHDGERVISPAPAYAETSMTLIAEERGWYIPRVGDWLKFGIGDSFEWRLVSEVALDGTDYILTWETPIVGEVVSFSAYETIITRLQWQTHGLVGKSSLFRELLPQVTMYTATARDAVSMTCGAAADIQVEPTTATNAAISTSLVKSRPERFGVSRDVARSSHLYPYFEMGEPSAKWAVHAMAVEYEPTSEKMKR